jgi:hypothetical protein
MAPYGMLRRVALVSTDISDELSPSCIRVFLRSVRRLLVTASVVPCSPILVTLMKEARSSSETPVITRATLRNIPEDAILNSLGCTYCCFRAARVVNSLKVTFLMALV